MTLRRRKISFVVSFHSFQCGSSSTACLQSLKKLVLLAYRVADVCSTPINLQREETWLSGEEFQLYRKQFEPEGEIKKNSQLWISKLVITAPRALDIPTVHTNVHNYKGGHKPQASMVNWLHKLFR